MNWLSISDPLAQVSLQAGNITTPRVEKAAAGESQMDTEQRSTSIGEPVPIAFALRRNGHGGVLVSPGATEARFDLTGNRLRAYYHLVISEGIIGSVSVRDVFQRSCRVGTFTQTYDRRAGTWLPGNYIPPNVNIDVSSFTGSIGTYPDMSTMSFYIDSFSVAIATGTWRKQVHVFVRSGMHVTRLIDNAFDASDNFADLVQWMLVNGRRVPSQLIDVDALRKSARFLEANGLHCNTWITESTNYYDFIAAWAPYFLLCESNQNGKRGLRPVLPTNSDGALTLSPINWKYIFTEEEIVPGSFNVQYVGYSERLPFAAVMNWRQQVEDDIGIMRSAEVRFANTAPDGPYESHDMSAYCTTENHAVKVGAYILARRLYVTHTIKFSARPQAHASLLSPGDIVRVRLQRFTQSTGLSFHDFLYQVERISQGMNGSVDYDCSLFPVNEEGKSILSLIVSEAVGAGYLIEASQSGVSCDVPGRVNDETVPEEEGIDPEGNLDPSFPENWPLDENGDPVPWPLDNDGVLIPWPTDGNNDPIPWPTDENGNPVPWPTDENDDPIAWPTDENDDPIAWPTDENDDPIAWPTDENDDPIAWPTDEEDNPIPWPTDENDDPIAWPTDENDDPIAWPTDENDDPIAWPVDENGNPIPWPVDENGDPIPWPVDENGDPIPWPVDENGDPVPWPVDGGGDPIPWPVDGNGDPIPFNPEDPAFDLLKDENDNSIFPVDGNGYPLFPLDPAGLPLFPLDPAGLPLFPLGPTGLPLVSLGSNGLPLFPLDGNGFPLFPLDDNGFPLFPLDGDGFPLFPLDGGGLPLFPLDNGGLPLFPIDNGGLPLFPVGPDGLPLFPLDNNGFPLFPLDGNGLPLFPLDDNGFPSFPLDDNGVPDFDLNNGGTPDALMGGDGTPSSDGTSIASNGGETVQVSPITPSAPQLAISSGSGLGGDGPDEPEDNPVDELDEPLPSLEVFPPGPLQPGSAVVMESNPCGAGKPPPKWRWLEGDEELVGENKRYKVIGTAFIDSPGLDAPLRGQYLCQDEDWASMNPIYSQEIEPLPPGREFQFYWQVNIRSYGFINPVGGWFPQGVVFKVVPEGEPISNWQGNISQLTRIDRINVDGSVTTRTRGYDGKVSVIKTRYRDNGGDWQEYADFRELL